MKRASQRFECPLPMEGWMTLLASSAICSHSRWEAMRWYSQISLTFGCPLHWMSSSSSQFLHAQRVLLWKPQVSPFHHTFKSRQWYSPKAIICRTYSSGVSHCCRQQKLLIRAVLRKLSIRHPKSNTYLPWRLLKTNLSQLKFANCHEQSLAIP